MPIAVLGLLLPLGFGVLAGWRRWFADPAVALDALNRFALTVAFPALVVVALASGELPTGPAAWLAVPVSVGLSLLPLPLVHRLGARSGTVGLVLVFGNVAYLGLPVVEAVFGPSAMGTASLFVGLHIALSMTLGPWLLASGLRWEGGDGLAGLLRQPLLWSPVVGLLLRALGPAGQSAAAVLAPLGRAAGPVALFVLGLYLFGERRRVARVDAATWVHVLAKGVWAPLVSLGVMLALRRWAGASDELVRVAVVLAAMPPAVTTFSIARELGGDEARVAQAIVVGTLLAALTVPVVVWALGALAGP